MAANNIEKSYVSCSSPGTNLYPNDTAANIQITREFNNYNTPHLPLPKPLRHSRKVHGVEPLGTKKIYAIQVESFLQSDCALPHVCGSMLGEIAILKKSSWYGVHLR